MGDAVPLAAKGRSKWWVLLRVAVPIVMLIVSIGAWALLIYAYDTKPYILPSPLAVAIDFKTDWPVLFPAWLVTLKITFAALFLAATGGVALAIATSQSEWLELAIYPYAVILQVTPIVAIAPLILIYAPSTQMALLICAFLVAFFPVLSNMTQGLKSVDHNLLDLYELYGASRFKTMVLLKLPAAQPYFLAGLRIAGGLSLIAAVVAEFAAGSAGQGSGLAFRLLEAQYRLNLPRLFAALILLTGTGVVIFAVTSLISFFMLRRWHESVLRREN